jgi:hypothetical protein
VDETFNSRGVHFVVIEGQYVSVVHTGLAGGSGNEISHSNAILQFDFGGSLNGLSLRFCEAGAENLIMVNGTTRWFSSATQLQGLVIEGVTISVEGVPDEFQYLCPGSLHLEGPIHSFATGFIQMTIDDVCPH